MNIDDGNQEWVRAQPEPVAWSAQPADWPTQPLPWLSGPPPRPPRSAAAAALLNLTGLALGYAYLGRWLRAALYLVGTVGFVVLAFVTDAADWPWPWRVLAVVWPGWMAFEGWSLARRTHPHPLTTGGRVVPVAVGVLLVGTVVAGHLFYGAAGRQVYAEALEAEASADCPSAITKYDTVTGPYELTLSRDVPAAKAKREQCVAFAAASGAEQQGAYDEAVRRYREYRAMYPGTVLVRFVPESLERTYNSWARALRSRGDHPAAIGVYRDLLAETGSAQARTDLAATYFAQADGIRAMLPTSPAAQRVGSARTAVDALLVVGRELGDTPTAPQVPQAIVDTFTAANSLFTEQRFCDALPVLDYFVTLPDAETAGVVGTANAHRVQALLECGLGRYREAAYPAAITQLEALVGAYPDSPQAAQARSAIIAAKVSAELGGPPLPLPAPYVDDSPGNNLVTFYNASRVEDQVLLAGPTAHELTLPGCPECPVLPSSAGCPSPAGKPSVTFRLGPGTYQWLSPRSDPPVFRVEVRSGSSSSYCIITHDSPALPS